MGIHLQVTKHLTQQLHEYKQTAVAKYCDEAELCVYDKPVGRKGRRGGRVGEGSMLECDAA